MSTFRFSALVLVAAALSTLAACGEDESSDDSNNTGVAPLGCEISNDGITLCNETGDGVVVCHADDPNDIHFDNVTSCVADGLTCTQLTSSEAGCLDPESSCTAADATRDDAENTAYNCFEGQLVIERCGSARLCELHEGEAHCEGGEHEDHEHEGEGSHADEGSHVEEGSHAEGGM